MLHAILSGLVTRCRHFALEKKNYLWRERQITIDIHTLPHADRHNIPGYRAHTHLAEAHVQNLLASTTVVGTAVRGTTGK